MTKIANVLAVLGLTFCFTAKCYAKKTNNDAAASKVNDIAAKQWNYYKENSKTDNKEILSSLLKDICVWLGVDDNSSYADSMLLLKAQIEQKLSLHRGSVVTLVKHRYLYPKSQSSFNVKSMLNGIIDKKITKSLRQPLKDLSEETLPVSSIEDKVAYFLNSMVEKTGDYFYDALAFEFYDFFAKYPHYPHTDKLMIALGRLETADKNYDSAIMQYDKVAKFYPESSYLPQSRLMIGKVMADNLKEYNAAISIYQGVVDKFPNTQWHAIAFEEMAGIAERQKQYNLAVEIYDKIIQAYAKKDFAYKAMIAKARIYHQELGRLKDAVKVLKDVDIFFKGRKAISALSKAAEIAGKDLKDYNMQADIYGTIAERYPDSVEAPQALYEMGYIYETKLENPAKAISVYKKVAAGYPGNSFSLKAKERIEKLKR